MALLLSILLLVFLTAASPAQAGVNWWTPIGPEGGVITSLAVDPASETLYAAATGNIFVSTNGGGVWQRRSRGLETVSHVAASSEPVPVVYAATERFLYRSTDGGVSWVATSTYPGFGGAWALAVDPSDSSKVYVGTPFDGVLKSTDGGVTWSSVFDNAVCGFIYSLEISTASPSTLYVGCEAGRVPFFKSTDGGVTWVPAASSLPDGEGREIHLALAPDAAGVLYASAKVLVGIEYEWRTYKSIDDGASWTRLPVGGIPVVAGPGGLVFVGKHRSTDGGQTWHELSLPLEPDSLILDPDDPDLVYAGLLSGIYRSTDAGATWSLRSRGLFASQVPVLEIDPREPTLYAVIPGLGVRKRVAGQTRWQRADAGLPLDDVFASFELPALAIDPVVPSNLYLGWRGGFARSSDGGASWTAISDDEAGCAFIRELDVDPRDPDRIYAAGVLSREGTCTSPSGPTCLVFHSDDAGATWTCAGSAPLDFVTELVVDPSSQPSRLYVATLGEGLWTSTDRGGAWRKLKSLRRFNNTITAFAVDPRDPRRLYAGDLDGRVYKSADRGATWIEASRGLPPLGNIRQIAVDPQRPQTLYVINGGSIYISGNRGQTWHPLVGGLPSAALDLVLDPTNSRNLYTGTARNGVYAHERR